MKRPILFASCIFLFACLTAFPVWAVWEGNAGIGNASDFPGPGMYAKSDMFPKNTIVEIVNLETEVKVRAVITGSSGVPGLVAVLSPETAHALFIRSGSVSRVRISIPQTVFETPAPGTIDSAAEAATNNDPDLNPQAAVSEEPATIVEEPAAETPDSRLLAASEAPLMFSDAEEPAVAEEPAAVADEPAAVAAEPDAVTEESDAVAEEPEAVAEEPEAIAEEPEAIAEEPAVETADSRLLAASEEPLLFSEIEEPESDIPQDSFYDEPDLVLTNPVVEPDVTETESEVTLVPAELKPPVSEVAPITVLPESAVAMAPVPVVPSPQPPAKAAPKPLEPVRVVEPITVPEAAKVQSVVKQPVEQTPVQPQASKAQTQVTQTPAPVSVTTAGFPFISSLTKDKYYVQIGTYAEAVSVKTVIDTYGKTWPLAVQKGLASGKDVLKVYVGPVTRDEYGAILERFKGLGFKDAFAVKGN